MVWPLIVASIVTSGVQAYTSYEAGEEQKEAGRLQQRQAGSKAALERRRIVREERVRRAQIIASSAGQGTQGSSGEAGAIGGLSNQLGTNLSNSYAQQALSARIGERLQNAQNLRTVGQIAGVFGNHFTAPGAP